MDKIAAKTRFTELYRFLQINNICVTEELKAQLSWLNDISSVTRTRSGIEVIYWHSPREYERLLIKPDGSADYEFRICGF
jgi:hypothetical protein